MNVNPYIIKWYHSFLTDRVQLVKVNQTLSQTVLTNTSAPQGCVSSLILYILYTNDCTSSSTNNYIITFSDDSAILSLLHIDSDISMYTSDIESFVHWCNINHLKLNISKTQDKFFLCLMYCCRSLAVTMCILYIYFMTVVVTVCILYIYFVVVLQYAILRNKGYIVIVEPG